MSLRAVEGVRAARRSNGFFSQRSQKHLSDMMNSQAGATEKKLSLYRDRDLAQIM